MAWAEIPFEELETVFLDAGNTLVSMDYEWIGAELEQRGVTATKERVIRAEAAARPTVSRAIAGEASTEGSSTFALYLRTLIEHLGGDAATASELARELVPVLRGPGREKLWSTVLPGVPEALEELRALGLHLSVVSNSDGTVENVLAGCGLRPHLEHVFDSHVVGFEKPDRRLFDHALDETGATAETTLHVGDIYAADVVGARAAGLHAALLDPYDDWTGVDCPRFESMASVAQAFRSARGR